LNCFDNLQIPPETDVRIVIVENDSENFSENVVNEFSAKSKIKTDYFLEKRQGIVFARNRSVDEAGKCDFCCFVDDDQLVDSKWLAELTKCQKEFNADGVSGSSPPMFLFKVPEYIKHFHTRKTYPYGTIRESANTGCLLLRKEYLDRVEGPFDIRLNFTGGEDSYLTHLITIKGGVIRYNPDAIASEVIPKERTTIKFVLIRSFRIANTMLLVDSLKDKEFNKWDTMPRLIMRLINGLLLLIPYLIFGKTNRLFGLIKISRAIGGLSFVLGKTNQFYKV